MKKLYYSLLIFAFYNSYSQKQDSIQFNKWSIEARVGMNKPVKPYTDGYFSSDPKNYFNISGIDSYDFGIRYMLTDKFGLSLNLGYDKIENQNESGSLPFKSEQFQVGLQGVANLGNLFNFHSFTKRINLLAHGGIQISQFTPRTGRFNGITEDNGGLVFGITPLIKISERVSFLADFSVNSNVRQHYNWDGLSLSTEDNNLSGLLYKTSFGISYYIGKSKTHADWYYKDPSSNIDTSDEEARKKIAELENMLQDNDRDGVANYLDVQNNTPNGLVVDSKGRFIDENKNGVPDELERKEITSNLTNSDAMTSLVEKGYINIFFDINQDVPNSGSTESVFQIIQFMKSNPQKKVKLLGFADLRGGEKLNKDLSNRRAQNIYKILTNSGIDKNRISISAQGVDKNFNNEDKSSLELARRVSIILVE